MNIAISGYGKMGKSLENQLITKHNLIIVSPETNTSFEDIKENIDVIIDFSSHEVIKDIEEYLLNKKCSFLIDSILISLFNTSLIIKAVPLGTSFLFL